MIQDGGKMVYGKGTGIYCSKKNHSVKRRCEMVVIWNPTVQITR